MLYSEFKEYIRAYNQRDIEKLSSYWLPNCDGGAPDQQSAATIAEGVSSFWKIYGDAELDLLDFMYQPDPEHPGNGEIFYAMTQYYLYNKKAGEGPDAPKLNDLTKVTTWVRYHLENGKVASMVGHVVASENLGQADKLPETPGRLK